MLPAAQWITVVVFWMVSEANLPLAYFTSIWPVAGAEMDNMFLLYSIC